MWVTRNVKTISASQNHPCTAKPLQCFVKIKTAGICSDQVKDRRQSEGLTAVMTGMVMRPLSKSLKSAFLFQCTFSHTQSAHTLMQTSLNVFEMKEH